MSNSATKIHWSFWVIGVLALVWNVMGAANYLMQMNPEAIASYPESHRAIITGRPAWATAGFAVAVFGGALGCLMLLLRKSAARYLLIASLLGVIVAMIHTVGLVGTTGFSGQEIALMILMPLIVAVFLVWYATRINRRGWNK